MGKLLHKLVHGIMPSWLFTGFRRTDSSSKKQLHFRPRQGIHFIFSKSSAPASPSSSAPLNTELMDMDQSTYYYSQSEGEQERPITGNNSNCISSPSIENESHDVDDDDDHLHARHNPRMGICALAATSIIKGRWNEDKHELPSFANKEIKYPTSPASINLQSQLDNDDRQHSHQQEGCLDHPFRGHHDNSHCGHGCHHQHQHQPQHEENYQQHHIADGGARVNQSLQHQAHNGPHTNKRPQHHAVDASLCQHDDDVYQHAHHHHGHGNNQLRASKHGRTKPNVESHTIPSLETSAEAGTQHNYGHHHLCHRQHSDQCQNDDQYYQHNASSSDNHQPHLGGFKRKCICLDEDDGKEDAKDEDKYQCSIRAWLCLKRQKIHKGGNVACELPECICEMVGNGSAVVQYSYQNPQFAFWESMVEMIVGNELRGWGELEFLLHCYLALNEPNLHHTIHTSFLQVLKDLQESLPLQRFMSMAQVDKVNTT